MKRWPGSRLLHPLALLALATLVINDHWLKHAHPSFLTGKLSDVAGLLLLPLFIQALFELGAARLRPSALAASRRVLFGALLLTAIGFAFVELSPWGDRGYRYGLGALQWLALAPVEWIAGRSLRPLRPVSATPDATDLLALPTLLVAWRIGSPSCQRRAPATPTMPERP
jgi:hypothetical protein